MENSPNEGVPQGGHITSTPIERVDAGYSPLEERGYTPNQPSGLNRPSLPQGGTGQSGTMGSNPSGGGQEDS